jgi:hypothetical protein
MYLFYFFSSQNRMSINNDGTKLANAFNMHLTLI